MNAHIYDSVKEITYNKGINRDDITPDVYTGYEYRHCHKIDYVMTLWILDHVFWPLQAIWNGPVDLAWVNDLMNWYE